VSDERGRLRFHGSEVHGSEVQRFKGSTVQGFRGSEVQGFNGSRVQRFKTHENRAV
jgi:hypothetical protein